MQVNYERLPYLSIDGLEVVSTMVLMEYYPLLSSRVHNFLNNKKNKILNIQFRETY